MSRSIRFRLCTLASLSGLALAAFSGSVSADDKAGMTLRPAGTTDAGVSLIQTPLIPRATLFGNPEKAAPEISPDGSKLAFLAPVNGIMNVFVGPANDITQAKPVTNDTKRGIRVYNWAYDNSTILYSQDEGGDENWKVYAVNLSTNSIKDLTPFSEVMGPDGKPIMQPNGKPLRPAAQIEGVSEKFPNEILIALNNRNPELHDLYRCNITTGELTLAYQNNEFAAVTTDDNYKLRFAAAYNDAGGMDWFKWNDADEKFAAYETVPQEDNLTTGFAGFDKSGNTAYLLDSRGRNTAGLFARDLTTNKTTLIAQNPLADAGDVLMHPTEKTIQAVAFNRLRNEWTILDPSIKPDLEYLKSVHEGEIDVTGRSLDDKTWLVTYSSSTSPAQCYIYNRTEPTKRNAKFLFAARPALQGQPLAAMHPIVIKSRDGMDLVSYLTLPPAVEKMASGYLKADGSLAARPAALPAIPMVLLVHGGPWARDSYGYNGTHQWLANRGYAVLSVNFRGSTGMGKDFINAGNREWAGKMHDDLIDAVNWATTNGIADKNKVAIMGGSYGGYATLVGLTFTPEAFACGVDIVGPSNIVTLLNTIPPYWQPMVKEFTTRVGDHQTEEGRKFLESKSPLAFVDKITKPLLIGQGANDPRVKQSEADQIVAAMNTKSIPVTYVLFPDEGHGFARPENRTGFNAVTEAFLSKHLGGRAEPMGGDVRKSSAQIPHGVEFIPGLSEAAGK